MSDQHEEEDGSSDGNEHDEKGEYDEYDAEDEHTEQNEHNLFDHHDDLEENREDNGEENHEEIGEDDGDVDGEDNGSSRFSKRPTEFEPDGEEDDGSNVESLTAEIKHTVRTKYRLKISISVSCIFFFREQLSEASNLITYAFEDFINEKNDILFVLKELNDEEIQKTRDTSDKAILQERTQAEAYEKAKQCKERMRKRVAKSSGELDIKEIHGGSSRGPHGPAKRQAV